MKTGHWGASIWLAFLIWSIFPAAAQALDTDGDGMPDGYENTYACLMPNTPDGAVDFDGDGLTNLAEYNFSVQLNPCFPDTDFDGAMDGFEIAHGSNPLDNRVRPNIMFNFQTLIGETRVTWPGAAWKSALAWTGSSFVLAWSDDRFGFMTSEIFSVSLGLRGDTLGPEVRLAPGHEAYTPRLVNRGSELGLAWIEPNPSATMWFSRLAADGSTLDAPGAAGAGWHDLSMVWTGSEFGAAFTYGGVVVNFKRLTADGDTIGPDQPVTPVASMYDPSLAWSGSEFGLAWRNDLDHEIYFERLLADGTTEGPELRVTNDIFNDSQPSVAWSGSEYGLAWTDQRNGNLEIYFNRVSPAGALIGSDVRISFSPGNCGLPVLVWAAQLNEYGLDYTDNGGGNSRIYFQRLGVAGNAVEGRVQVSGGAGMSEFPTLAWTGSYFGVSWINDQVGLGQKKTYFSIVGSGSDSDGDMLQDFNESAVYGTDPGYWDTDHDSMPDGWEVSWAMCGLDPLAADSTGDPDGDLLSNLYEYNHFSSPCFLNDMDGDGMSDGYELQHACLNVNVYDAYLDGDNDGILNLNEKVLGSDPCDNDTDNDGMTDGFEANHACLYPLVGDSTGDPDGEGLKNLAEFNALSNPCVPDTDGDGLSDYDEVVVYHSNPLLPNSDGDAFSDWIEVMVFDTDPAVYDPDTDLDGLPDAVETGTGDFIDPTDTGTSPLMDDTDGDHIDDYDEIFIFGTDPNSYDPDTDGDGLLDVVETNTGVFVDFTDTGTNPNAADTDGDGVKDLAEILAGSNPFERLVVPGPVTPIQIGAPVRITNNTSVSQHPDIVWTGSEYGLTFDDDNGSTGKANIVFRRIGADGSLPGNLMWLTYNGFDETTPSLAFNPTAGEYALVYSSLANDSDHLCNPSTPPGYDCNYDIIHFRMNASGQPISSGMVYGQTFREYVSPGSLAWSGSEYGMAFITQASYGAIYELRFKRLSSTMGQLVNSVQVMNPSCISNCGGEAVSWSGTEFGLSWTRGSENWFGRVDAVGATITPFIRLNSSGLPTRTTNIWANGGFEAAWADGSQLSFSRIVNGSLVDTDQVSASRSPSYPALAWTGAAYGLARIEMTDLMFSQIAVDGSTVAPSLLVAAPAADVSLAYSGSEFGLAYADGNEIYFTRLVFAYDSDGDGLSDRQEGSLGTNTNYWDTDHDGLPDGFEQDHLACLNPLAVNDKNADPDGDLATNIEEFHTQSNPCVFSDADADGMPDAWETAHPCMNRLLSDAQADYDSDTVKNIDEYNLGSDPCDNDTDKDTMPDGYEVQYAVCGLSLINGAPADHDMDTLLDADEYVIGTSPCDPDTDDDLMRDDYEHNHACLDPLVGDSLNDPDSDGIPSGREYVYHTDPCLGSGGDTDGDGLSDLDEITIHFTDPYDPDTDGDGLSDGQEISPYETSPIDADSDNDGVSDGAEVAAGTDPKDPQSFPGRTAGLVNYQGRLMDATGVAFGGTATMKFALFGLETGGTEVWSETRQVPVVNGIYNVVLGGDTTIPPAAMASDAWLEIAVNGQTLAPRSPVTAAVSSINADRIAGRRLETGSRTLTVNPAAAVKVVHVAFEKSFVGPPRVVVTSLDGPIGAEVFVNTRIFNVTAAGFDAEWRSLTSAVSSGSAAFGYGAVGQ